MPKITAPANGYSGESVCGVVFTGGVAHTDNPAALDYFTRHGYSIEADKPAPRKRAKAVDSE